MKLILTRGSPYPRPDFPTEGDMAKFYEEFSNRELALMGVHSVEFLYDFTVRFESIEDFARAKIETGWAVFNADEFILCMTTEDDAYLMPGVVAGDCSYSGIFMEGD